MGKKLKWTVEFEIDEVWVEDGFQMTDEIAKDMIEERLGFSHSHETSAKVVQSPDPKLIRQIQGYKEPASND